MPGKYTCPANPFAQILPFGRRQFKYDREGEEGLARAIAGDNSPLRLRGANLKTVELILGMTGFPHAHGFGFLVHNRHHAIRSFSSSHEYRTDNGLYWGIATRSSP